MKAVSKRSALAQQPLANESPRLEGPPHEQRVSGVSGMRFRAVRPDDPEARALAPGESIDTAKVEGLRFELDIGIWRADSEHVALRIIDDAEPFAEVDSDDE